MIRKILIVVAVVLVVVFGYFIINKPTSNQIAKEEVASISAQIDKVSGQLVDVRTADEYAADHALNAINIPLDSILGGDFSKFDKDKPIYVYCRSGNRAGQAKVALEKAGYKNVTNIGGLTAWEADGGKTCQSSKASC